MKKRETKTDARVEIKIARFCREYRDAMGRKPNAAKVRKVLEDDNDLLRLVPKDDRTIKRTIDELPTDESGTWSLEGAEPEEAAAVLPVLGYLARRTAIRTLTRREASLIHRIRCAAPRLAVAGVWELTQSYIEVTSDSEGESIRSYLDALLALTPSFAEGGRAAFDELVSQAQISDKAKNYLQLKPRLMALFRLLEVTNTDLSELANAPGEPDQNQQKGDTQ